MYRGAIAPLSTNTSGSLKIFGFVDDNGQKIIIGVDTMSHRLVFVTLAKLEAALAIEDFRRRAIASLAAYKQEVLGVAENGIWRKNRLPRRYARDVTRCSLRCLIRAAR